MPYSIKEVAQKFNLNPSTLRYYEKEGLLPSVQRSKAGIRIYSTDDINRLDIIECLKNTGMPIKEIKLFCQWCQEGDTTLKQRYDMFIERRKQVEQQLSNLQKTLDKINYKCWYYETALKYGSESVHQNK